MSTEVQKTTSNRNSGKHPVISSGVIVKYDDKKIKLTKGYVDAVKNLMREQILMMRQVHKDNADCWVCGVTEVTDIASVEGLKMMFGSKEDKNWLKRQGQIFIEVL